MKVLLINGSPHKDGNTHLALEEVSRTLAADGIDSEIFWIGNKAVQGCIGCYTCVKTGICVFKDELYLILRRKLEEADGIIIGTPVYYAGPAGSLCAILDRLFYSSSKFAIYKPAAAVCVCRRGGAAAAFDRLNKYFTILRMPVVSSQYWNMVFGRNPGEAAKDREGLQTMRTLGHNMAWMLKSLQSQQHPEPEPFDPMNFIREDC